MISNLRLSFMRRDGDRFDRDARLVDDVNKDLSVNGMRQSIDCFSKDLLDGPQCLRCGA